MSDQSKLPFIALCDSLPDQLRSPDVGSRDQISITIARLGKTGEREHPINWSLNSYGEEPRNSCGGCYCQLWLYKHPVEPFTLETIFSHYGPHISHGGEQDYEHALRAMRHIQKRWEQMAKLRGGYRDAAELLGRWFEACGVTHVWYRPERQRHHSWHSEGEWESQETGHFLNRVRQLMPEYAQPQPAAQAA